MYLTIAFSLRWLYIYTFRFFIFFLFNLSILFILKYLFNMAFRLMFNITMYWRKNSVRVETSNVIIIIIKIE